MILHLWVKRWGQSLYLYDQDLQCRIVETHFSAPHSIIVSAWCPSVSQFAMAEMVGGDPGETRKGFHVLSSMYLVPNTIQPVPGTAKLTVMHVAEYIVGGYGAVSKCSEERMICMEMSNHNGAVQLTQGGLQCQ